MRLVINDDEILGKIQRLVCKTRELKTMIHLQNVQIQGLIESNRKKDETIKILRRNILKMKGLI